MLSVPVSSAAPICADGFRYDGSYTECRRSKGGDDCPRVTVNETSIQTNERIICPSSLGQTYTGSCYEVCVHSPLFSSESETAITTDEGLGFYFSTDLFQKISPGRRVPLDDKLFASPAGVIGFFFNILFALAGVLMVVLLAVYGTQMIYSQVTGSVNKLIDAKKRVVDIAIGVCLLLFSWLILNFVNPDLLRLDFHGIPTTRSTEGDGSVSLRGSTPSCAAGFRRVFDGSKTVCRANPKDDGECPSATLNGVSIPVRKGETRYHSLSEAEGEGGETVVCEHPLR